MLLTFGVESGPAVTGTAYTGGTMVVSAYPHPIVVDLAGLTVPASVPLLIDHENSTSSKIGEITAASDGRSLSIHGRILSSSAVAADIVSQAKAGGRWQLSIGASVEAEEFVPEGERRVINGQTLTGPFHHICRSRLKEVSVLPLGADDQTQLSIAANFHFDKPTTKREGTMDIHAVAQILDITAGSDAELQTKVEGRIQALMEQSRLLEAAQTERDAIKAQLADIESASAGRRVDELIAAGKADGKLSAAMCVWAKQQSPAALESFLASASKVVPTDEDGIKKDEVEGIDEETDEKKKESAAEVAAGFSRFRAMNRLGKDAK